MALKTKLSFVSINKTGTVIIIKDDTGSYDLEDNPTGWGGANPVDVLKTVLTFNRFNTTLGKVVEQPNTNTNTELPTVLEMMNGENILVTSDVLNITPQDGGTALFNDGVLEVTMQSIINIPKILNAVKDSNFIIGAGLEVFDNYEEIYLGGKVYKINKTLPTNGGTVLHLNRDIEENGTQAYPIKVANLKIFIQNKTNRIFVDMIAKTAADLNVEKKFGQVERFPKLKPCLNIMIWKFGAKIAFDKKDYIEATRLLEGILLYANGEESCEC